ncbi:suf system fes cluster assembly sufbd [Trichococcus palustris]|uniref:Suf system fes cluster assembly sufbd n=1 Tax=Trichococcus palustris TaxID=140314 RepID=A0A143YR93_9LACT|nr:Fe-S cluster assembly protein SufD [Trichococcus palustris]CZQ95469.1 suf system fes cluster assembly sufbd [Trichococcus palustris]SFK96691.1 Fe-S cluster assembly protein SufD [Trichococcus palustris]
MLNEEKASLLDAVRLFSIEKEEPEWMRAKRLDMFEKYETLEFPLMERISYHRWPLLETNISVEAYGEELENSQGLQYEMNNNPKLVQYGKVTLMEQLPQHLIEQGVIFTDLFTAAQEYPELVKEYYMTTAVKPEEDRFTAFHTAFMNSGVFIYIPKNVVVEEPLEALFIQNAHVKESFVKHVLLVADVNSSVKYVERFETDGAEKNNANVVVEVIAKSGAHVKFSAVDTFGENTSVYLNRRGHLLNDSTIDWAIGVMNDGNVISDFDSDLIGDGSHSEIKVVAISTGKQVQGIDTRVTNYGKHSIGHILQHGVIMDRSTLTFNGIGHIIKGAKGADAQQESRVLMLSDKARGDANPILLIDENDVTAGHAASVGRVDPEDMFYLLSRGIPKAEAERLVIRGFLGTVIAAIPIKEIRDNLVEMIERKLKKA